MALQTEKCCETTKDATLLDDAELENIAGGRQEKDFLKTIDGKHEKDNKKKSGNKVQ